MWTGKYILKVLNIIYSFFHFRYITAIGAKNETEMLDLRQLLLGDAELQRTVDLVRISHVVTSWGHLMGSPHVVTSCGQIT